MSMLETNGLEAPRLPGTFRHSADVWIATLALVVIVAGAGVTAQRLWSFAHTRRDESAAISAPDAALDAGASGIQAFNTIDSRHARAVVDGWLALSTSQLHASLARTRSAAVKQLRQKHTRSTARVTARALTSYDAKAGTATVVAVIAVVAGQQPATTKRYVAQVRRAHGSWKLAGLAPIAVGS